MKTFSLNDTQYSIPTELSEITLGQFVQITKLFTDPHLSNIEKAGQVVALLTGLPIEVIEEAEPKLVLLLFGEVNLLEEALEIEAQPLRQFALSGQTYQVNTLAGSTFREFAAYDKTLSVFKTQAEAFPYQLAILCRLPGETLKQVDVEARAELFRGLDMETVQRITTFFLFSAKHSQLTTQRFSAIEKARTEIRAVLKQSLRKGTGGSILSSLFRQAWIRLTLSLM